MNVGIVTSFIIAALLLISVMAWNMRVSQNSGIVTLTQIAKQRSEAVGTLVYFDLRNLGQGVATNPLVAADSNRIEFEALIPGQGVQHVIWQWNNSSPLNETQNPHDRLLTRTINGNVTEMRYGVTRFRLIYLDSNGAETTTVGNIRRIRVLLKVESDTPYDNGRYITSYWESEVTPRALR